MNLIMWIGFVVFAIVTLALMMWKVKVYPYWSTGPIKREPLLQGVEYFWAPVIGLMAGAFVTMMCGMFVAPNRYEEVSSFNIVALGDSSTVTGRFFLGSGSVNGSQTYAYMYRTSDGGFKMGSKLASDSVIYDDADPGTARVEKWMGVSDTWLNGGTTWGTVPKYKIHVPPNSVVQNYVVDVTN